MRSNDLVWIVGIGLAAAAIVLTACESSNSGKRGNAREVALAEFSNRTAHTARETEAIDERSDTVVDSIAPGDRSDQTAPPVEVETETAPLPQLGAGPAPGEMERLTPESGTRVIVDSLVGQVNGRPIYADSFFEPIADQLRAIGRRVGQREFVAQSHEIITEHLSQIIQNELFLADAQAQLSQEQQKGLFAWMRAIREQTIMEGGGTASAAQRRLEQQGMTMDEYLAARRDMALVQKLQEERIRPRVIVSWRDIEREYQRRFHEFNPPARMKVSRIRLSTERDAEQIAQVREQLVAGADFADVAQSVGMADSGAWQEFEIGEEGVDGLQLSESIKQHLRDLEVGQTSQPFEVGASTWWLHVAQIDQPEGRSLYDPDVQRMLYEQIRQRRFNQELHRYINSLFAEGVYDDMDKMRERLVVIAYERYGPK